MPKREAVRVSQELLEEAKKEVKRSRYRSLSEFVSEAIRIRLEALAKEGRTECVERDKQGRILQPQGQLRYTPRHIWLRFTYRGNVQLGVTDYFESQLEGIEYIGDFQEGETLCAGKPFGTIETVGWPFIMHALFSPIDGKIVKVNKDVLDNPYILNEDPYQWIIEVQPDSPKIDMESKNLLSLEEYKELIAKHKEE